MEVRFALLVENDADDFYKAIPEFQVCSMTVEPSCICILNDAKHIAWPLC